MKTAEQITEKWVKIAEEKINMLDEILSDIERVTKHSPAIPHEINMIKAGIEGRRIGLTDFIRSTK